MKKIKNNLKKILIGFTLIFICVGCNNSSLEEKLPDVDLFDSKIDYILFRDKKIYLSQNLEDYLFQFKGLNCKFRATDSQISSDMSIDNINDNNHTFYSLYTGSIDNVFGEGQIRCHDDIGGGDNEFDIRLYAANPPDKSNVLYTDMKIVQWNFESGFANEEIKIFIDGESLSIESKSVSTKDDVVRLMGSNYEVDKGIYYDDYESFIYHINDIKYKFSFDDDNLLYKLEVIIKVF